MRHLTIRNDTRQIDEIAPLELLPRRVSPIYVDYRFNSVGIHAPAHSAAAAARLENTG